MTSARLSPHRHRDDTDAASPRSGWPTSHFWCAISVTGLAVVTAGGVIADTAGHMMPRTLIHTLIIATAVSVILFGQLRVGHRLEQRQTADVVGVQARQSAILDALDGIPDRIAADREATFDRLDARFKVLAELLDWQREALAQIIGQNNHRYAQAAADIRTLEERFGALAVARGWVDWHDTTGAAATQHVNTSQAGVPSAPSSPNGRVYGPGGPPRPAIPTQAQPRDPHAEEDTGALIARVAQEAAREAAEAAVEERRSGRNGAAADEPASGLDPEVIRLSDRINRKIQGERPG